MEQKQKAVVQESEDYSPVERLQAEMMSVKKIEENPKTVQLMFGHGYTGLVNFGNSCYLAASVQIAFATRAFISRYYENQTLKDAFNAALGDPSMDLNMQLTKLGHGLLSGKYSNSSSEEGISPAMFKVAVASGHPDFSTTSQQDTFLFFLHLLQQVKQVNSEIPELDPSTSFQFTVEQRIQCPSGKVSYKSREEYYLGLNIPLQEATNKDQVEAFQKLKSLTESEEKDLAANVVRPRVPLEACLASYLAPEELEFTSTELKDKVIATKTVGLTSFPEYLVLRMNLFVREGLVQRKLDVLIDVPDIIDISHMRSSGLQPGEVLLPDSPDTEVQPAKEFLQERDATELQPAKELLQESDATELQPAKELLQESSATELSDAADINMPGAEPSDAADINMPGAEPSDAADTDKPAELSSRYRLVGFINHIGATVHDGHYIAYIFKEDKWIQYNDATVSVSVCPPKEVGYVYLYERLVD